MTRLGYLLVATLLSMVGTGVRAATPAELFLGTQYWDNDKPVLPGEVIGILYGKTYTYADLGPKPYPPGTRGIGIGQELPAQLRGSASSMFQRRALLESIRRRMRCDPTPTKEEIADFIAWWQAETRKQDPVRLARLTTEEYGAPKTADDMSSTVPALADAAAKHVFEWKQYNCLAWKYGGRVNQDQPIPGVRPLGRAIGIEAGFIFPFVSRAIPVEALRQHFTEMMADGELALPDARYADFFFHYNLFWETPAWFPVKRYERLAPQPEAIRAVLIPSAISSRLDLWVGGR